jgi:hypothetical protein
MWNKGFRVCLHHEGAINLSLFLALCTIFSSNLQDVTIKSDFVLPGLKVVVIYLQSGSQL